MISIPDLSSLTLLDSVTIFYPTPKIKPQFLKVVMIVDFDTDNFFNQ